MTILDVIRGDPRVTLTLSYPAHEFSRTQGEAATDTSMPLSPQTKQP